MPIRSTKSYESGAGKNCPLKRLRSLEINLYILRLNYLLLSLLLIACGSSSGELDHGKTAPQKYERGFCTGLSAFGLLSENFQGDQCSRFLQIQSGIRCSATSILWSSFGNNPSCLYRWIEQGEEKKQQLVLQIHFSGEVLRKTNRLIEQDWMPELSFAQLNRKLERNEAALVNKTKERATEIVDLLLPYLDRLFVVISVGLEDQFTTQARRNLISILKKVFNEKAQFAINPDNYDVTPEPGLYFEAHGYERSPKGELCFLNGDGDDINILPGGGITLSKPPASLSKIMDWYARARDNGCIALLWYARSQGVGSFNSGLPINRDFDIKAEDVEIIKSLFKSVELNEPR